MKAIGNESNGSKHDAADDFRQHHRTAKPDHCPGFALAFLVSHSKE
jgi:hypothetical protein